MKVPSTKRPSVFVEPAAKEQQNGVERPHGRRGEERDGELPESESRSFPQAPPKGALVGMRKPVVVGHRGLASRAPENTLASYRLALAEGISIVECDIHMSADGVPVLMHDRSLERTTGTKGLVSDKSLAELKGLDAGSWKGAQYIGEPIPTLREFLDLCRKRARVAIEVKQDGTLESVIEVLKEAGFPADAVNIFAWDPHTVAAAKQQLRNAEATLLVEGTPFGSVEREALVATAVAAGASHLGVENIHCDEGLFDAAHRAGLAVFVWTVNDLDDVVALLRMGADGIISDCPEQVRSFLTSK